ncbi:MAG: hypothetical protein ACLT98_13180 [Eggerthellaceae bacterium]
MLASPDEEGVIRSSYDETPDGSYAINEKGLNSRDELDGLAKPLAETYFARSGRAATRRLRRGRTYPPTSGASRMRKEALTISTPA